MVDWRTYALCGDCCMMEGISNEAASLAGHLGLDKLCWIYDSNRVTIEGHTSITFTEDVAARFLSYGWNVLRVGDANDTDRIAQALKPSGTRRAVRRSLFSTAISDMARPTNRTRMRHTVNHWAKLK